NSASSSARARWRSSSGAPRSPPPSAWATSRWCGRAIEARAMIGLLVNHYRITRVLSEEGGMGVVYLGEHVTMGQQAVIKLLRPEFGCHPEVVARFLNEARAAATIRHPGIVTIFDQGTLADGRAYLTMEYLSGE